MKEQIKFLNDTEPNIILFNAMSAHTLPEEILEKFKVENIDGVGTTVEVQVLVNGIEVPYTEWLAKGVNSIVENYEEHIKEKAIALLTNSPLAELYNELENIEWKIRELIEKLEVSPND